MLAQGKKQYTGRVLEVLGTDASFNYHFREHD